MDGKTDGRSKRTPNPTVQGLIWPAGKYGDEVDPFPRVQGHLCLFCLSIVEPRPLGPHTAEDEQRFIHADTMFKGAMISILGESIVDTYVTMSTGKEMWDARTRGQIWSF